MPWRDWIRTVEVEPSIYGADFSRLPYMAELTLSTFPPGRYVLQLTAIDRAAKTTTSQRTRFVVE